MVSSGLSRAGLGGARAAGDPPGPGAADLHGPDLDRAGGLVRRGALARAGPAGAAAPRCLLGAGLRPDACSAPWSPATTPGFGLQRLAADERRCLAPRLRGGGRLWRTLAHSQAAVQFNHRIWRLACCSAWPSSRSGLAPGARFQAAGCKPLAVPGRRRRGRRRRALGIATLMARVPLWLGIAPPARGGRWSDRRVLAGRRLRAVRAGRYRAVF